LNGLVEFRLGIGELPLGDVVARLSHGFLSVSWSAQACGAHHRYRVFPQWTQEESTYVGVDIPRAHVAEVVLIRGVAWQRRPQETAHQGNDAHAVHLVYGPPDAELAAETGAAGRGRHAGIVVPLVGSEAQLDVEGPLRVGPSLYLGVWRAQHFDGDLLPGRHAVLHCHFPADV